jgi:DNA-binding CsgD family transcriptional regulator
MPCVKITKMPGRGGEETIFRRAIEAMGEGVALYDAEGRLQFCNRAFKGLLKTIGATGRIGTDGEDQLVQSLAGATPAARARAKQWLGERRRSRGAYSAIVRTPAGCVYRVNARPSADGGSVVVWTEVPELDDDGVAIGAATPRDTAAQDIELRDVLLSDRQHAVLKLCARGHSMKSIARALGITPRTVAFHKYQAMETLRLKSNVELFEFAREHGLLSVEGNEPTVDRSVCRH